MDYLVYYLDYLLQCDVLSIIVYYLVYYLL